MESVMVPTSACACTDENENGGGGGGGGGSISKPAAAVSSCATLAGDGAHCISIGVTEPDGTSSNAIAGATAISDGISTRGTGWNSSKFVSGTSSFAADIAAAS